MVLVVDVRGGAGEAAWKQRPSSIYLPAGALHDPGRALIFGSEHLNCYACAVAG